MAHLNHPTSFHENDLLFSEQFGDHYYSRNDGRAECAHVFLNGNDLPQRWTGRDNFTIGELGFGTGLNFLETWATWQKTRKKDQHLSFVSVEGFPLDVQTAKRALARWPELGENAETLLNRWTDIFSKTQLDEQTTLHVLQGEVSACLSSFPMVDAWYLDGFAPSKNPDMWSKETLSKVGGRTVEGGTCASYTAAGWVRRNLDNAGFTVEKRPGFGSKRDMIAGIKSRIKSRIKSSIES